MTTTATPTAKAEKKDTSAENKKGNENPQLTAPHLQESAKLHLENDQMEEAGDLINF